MVTSTKPGRRNTTSIGTTTSKRAAYPPTTMPRRPLSNARHERIGFERHTTRTRDMTTVRALLAAGLVLCAFGLATAKLPAPPPMTDEQKAAAEEKKAKDAAAAEV